MCTGLEMFSFGKACCLWLGDSRDPGFFITMAVDADTDDC
jgi:hypothetical protein